MHGGTLPLRLPKPAAIVFGAIAMGCSCALAGERPAVVELFTSQSCGTCPPADQLLSKLAQREDIIALSCAVTYWDYLGWKDTLALPECNKRQRMYAKLLHGEVYTPQAIVNGRERCVGSSEPAIEAAITTTVLPADGGAVDVKVEKRGEVLHLEAGAASAGSPYRSGRVIVIAAAQTVEVPIKRGENAGKVVTYANVVRNIADAGEWSGQAVSFDLPLQTVQPDGADFLVVLVQDKSGAIIGAGKLNASPKSGI